MDRSILHGGIFARYIYNRVILENATVRAAAVTALAKFGAACLKLRQSTLTLLKRCLHDNDDEVRREAASPLILNSFSNAAHSFQVRDRATFFIAVLEDESQVDQWTKRTDLPHIGHLERALDQYAAHQNYAVPFDFQHAVADTPASASAADARASQQARDRSPPFAARAVHAAGAVRGASSRCCRRTRRRRRPRRHRRRRVEARRWSRARILTPSCSRS